MQNVYNIDWSSLSTSVLYVVRIDSSLLWKETSFETVTVILAGSTDNYYRIPAVDVLRGQMQKTEVLIFNLL